MLLSIDLKTSASMAITPVSSAIAATPVFIVKREGASLQREEASCQQVDRVQTSQNELLPEGGWHGW